MSGLVGSREGCGEGNEVSNERDEYRKAVSNRWTGLLEWTLTFFFFFFFPQELTIYIEELV